MEYYQVMQSEIERMTGKELSQSESSTVKWIAGWEAETKANFMRLIRDAYFNGLRKR